MEWLEPDRAIRHAMNGVVDAFEKIYDETTDKSVWRRWTRALCLGR